MPRERNIARKKGLLSHRHLCGEPGLRSSAQPWGPVTGPDQDEWISEAGDDATEEDNITIVLKDLGEISPSQRISILERRLEAPDEQCEEREPEEKEARRILKRLLRMRQMRRYALRVRCQMWKSVLNIWCKLARDAAQRVEEFEMVRSAAMWRVTRDAARVACGSSNFHDA